MSYVCMYIIYVTFRNTVRPTWEPAENVPIAIINEFEQGIVVIVQDETTKSGLGQTTHTLKISSQRGNTQSQSHSVPRTAESNSQV